MSVGSFTHAAKAGANKFKLTGRVKRRALRPGSYRMRATARAGTATSRALTKNFRIVK